LQLHVADAFVVVQRHAVAALLYSADLLLAVAVAILILRILRVEVARLLHGVEALLIVVCEEIHTLTHLVASGRNECLLTMS
jgi:hypothetical protein